MLDRTTNTNKLNTSEALSFFFYISYYLKNTCEIQMNAQKLGTFRLLQKGSQVQFNF